MEPRDHETSAVEEEVFVFPASFAQQRLWYLDQVGPGSAAYNIPAAFRLSGPLDAAALERSLHEILCRHEVLRTSFAAPEGHVVQVVAPGPALPLPAVDLRALPAPQREAEARRLATAAARHPFDLAHGPLVRATLLRLGDEEHVLLLTLHHIVSDGWSTAVLLRELSALYSAFATGQPSPLPELPIQYADYAVWQRDWLQGEVLATQLAYWRRQLDGAPPVLQLPTDRPRPASPTSRGARQALVLPRSLTQRLEALSRHHGVTLFMTLLAAFQTLLHRHSGQDDIVVGTPIAGRTRPELEGLIGFFVNTLVLRTSLAGNPSFRELLGRVREVALGAYAHQDLPFEKLVQELRPERNPSHSPLFRVLFHLQNAPVEDLALPGLTVSRIPVGTGAPKFDLALALVEGAEGLRTTVEYDTDLFDAATIARLLQHFETLLEGIVADPGRRLAELALLTAAERQQLLVDWNQPPAEAPGAVCLHQLFEAQVERTPEAVAVVCGDRQLTYRALNARANQVARRLRARGVGPDVLVGICTERSLEMVVGALGILKAGGAYVPLDPTHPRERLALILADARVGVLLTQERLLGSLPEFQGEALCLDGEQQRVDVEPTGNPETVTGPDHLAYVVYTSGSTGTPKGVLGTHRGAVNYLAYLVGTYELGSADVVLQLASLAFDASVRDLLGPLTAGARVVVTNDAAAREPRLLLAQIREHGATCLLSVVPSLVNGLSEAAGHRDAPCDSVRLVLVSGEALHVATYRRAKAVFGPRALVVNQYGPTECAMTSTYYPVVAPPHDRETVPIGRPIPHAQVYLLDRHGNPVPIGVPGELHIGGPGLARGYLNRPGPTAERFIPHPFSDKPGARLYKTGDLARYLADGNLEFLGRVDRQVKIRGFRVEPEEVEAVLGQHPDVRETVVIVRDEVPGDTRLVAYVAPRHAPGPGASDLRTFLRTRLPDYMVPSAFVVVEALPRTPNGKLDRRALPAPGQAKPEPVDSGVAPRTPLEVELTRIWSEVLRLERIGLHDDFFELGGHSLQALQLASKLSAARGLEVSVRFLLEHPSIAALAAALENQPRIDGHARSRERPGSGDGTVSPASRPSERSESPFVTIERRPLLSLFATGKIAPVDAAALGSVPAELLARAGVSRDEVIQGWYDGLPAVAGVLDTAWGRIARIRLPRVNTELYDDQASLVETIVEALELAARMGARTVSLTGLIPSATDYGRAVATAIAGRRDLPAVSTGHATTVAAVIFAIRNVLHEAGRELARERVGFLGLGSIGLTSLRTMLRCLPHPARITLCDVYEKRDALARIRRQIASELGFRGPVHVAETRAEVPPAFYDATLVIGATNVADILDLTRVQPGTIIVDDSAPHCFAPDDAVRRFREREDILFTEGGVLGSPHPVSQLLYVPRGAEAVMAAVYGEALRRHDPSRIAGCTLSGLLSARFDELAPTVGVVADEACRQHYELLGRLGFRAADLHCRDFVLPEASIRNFRRRFGRVPDSAQRG